MPAVWPDKGVLNVGYRFIDGYHVFTSDEVDGLYVASKDPRRAYDDVRHAIKMLVLANDGVRINVDPMLNMREFLAMAKKAVRGEPEAFVLGSQQFQVSLAAA